MSAVLGPISVWDYPQFFVVLQGVVLAEFHLGNAGEAMLRSTDIDHCTSKMYAQVTE